MSTAPQQEGSDRPKVTRGLREHMLDCHKTLCAPPKYPNMNIEKSMRGQRGPRNAIRSREAEKRRNHRTSREAEKPRSTKQAEKPRSREAEKPPDKPRSREAEKPRSRQATGQAEKPRSQEAQRMTRMK